MRRIFEGIRSEIRQYLIESDQDEDPFGWEERSIVYQRVRNEEDKPSPWDRERCLRTRLCLANAFHRREHMENSDFRVAIGGAIIVRRRLVWQKFDRIWRDVAYLPIVPCRDDKNARYYGRAERGGDESNGPG